MQLTQATAALILAFTGTALAHSAVPLVQGDVAGSMTGIGFDPSVPVSDPKKNVIEVTANTMPGNGRNPNADGLGTNNRKKQVTMGMMSKAVAAGGPGPMPQVNEMMTITYRQMVIDGRFDPNNGAKVMIDPTATGTFSSGTQEATIVGDIPAAINQRKATIKGTTVVGQEAQFQVKVPDGLVCQGPDKTCLVRVVNGNPGQKWGGHFCFQQAADGSVPTTANVTEDASDATAGSPAGAAKKVNAARTVDLQALVARLNTYAEQDDADVDDSDADDSDE